MASCHSRRRMEDPDRDSEGLKNALTDFFRRNISEEFSLEDHT